MTIDRIQNVRPVHRVLSTRGNYEAFTNASFRILVTKFLKEPFVLQGNMGIALGMGPAECIMEPERNEGL